MGCTNVRTWVILNASPETQRLGHTNHEQSTYHNVFTKNHSYPQNMYIQICSCQPILFGSYTMLTKEQTFPLLYCNQYIYLLPIKRCMYKPFLYTSTRQIKPPGTMCLMQTIDTVQTMTVLQTPNRHCSNNDCTVDTQQTLFKQ